MEELMTALYKCVDTEKFKELTGYEFVTGELRNQEGKTDLAVISFVKKEETINFYNNK